MRGNHGQGSSLGHQVSGDVAGPVGKAGEELGGWGGQEEQVTEGNGV